LKAHAPILLVVASTIVACAQIVGIGDFPGARDGGSDAPNDVAADAPSSCGAAIITSSSQIDSITATGTFIFTQGFILGLGRCANGSTCTDPPPLLNLASGDLFEYAAISPTSGLVYSAQNGNGGSIHSTTYAGTNDTTIVTTALSPTYVASGGSNTYWVADGLPAEVHCVGCSASDAVWITNVNNPTALFADATAVYALASDSTNVTYGIFGCGANSACANNPRTVIEGLDQASVGPTNVASDGARVYVPRFGTSTVVAVDSLGATKTIVTGVQATALAVDGTNAELFYGTDTGKVGRVKTDGSMGATLATCGQEILAVSFDATMAYALVTTGISTWVVYAFPR
jgi:hypothetical protein